MNNARPLKRIWTGGSAVRANPTVDQRPDGGLVFSYDAYMHGETRCSFTLWCEVGEKYKSAFDGFFREHAIDVDPLIIAEKPYVLDRLKSNAT